MNDEGGIRLSRDLIMHLLSEERESIASYHRACVRYQIDPDPLAQAVSNERIRLLSQILDGKQLTLQSYTLKLRQPTVK
jgi:hypothetical protein